MDDLDDTVSRLSPKASARRRKLATMRRKTKASASCRSRTMRPLCRRCIQNVGKTIRGRWPYRDAAGRLLFEVWRFDPPDVRKKFPPL